MSGYGGQRLVDVSALSKDFQLNGKDVVWWVKRGAFVVLTGAVAAGLQFLSGEVAPSVDQGAQSGIVMMAVVQLLIELGKRWMQDNQQVVRKEASP